MHQPQYILLYPSPWPTLQGYPVYLAEFQVFCPGFVRINFNFLFILTFILNNTQAAINLSNHSFGMYIAPDSRDGLKEHTKFVEKTKLFVIPK